ncbi:MAG TPA: DUF503 domain-containing protein [Candidatus Polarisedimenticolia bacterium]|nr:DUF503 domain-containing protein [Candidatus Polarisedimenticolia bacterium]
MVVGICVLVIHLPQARSLKDKRQVVKSLKDRLRGRHNISIAEVDSQDLWQRAVIAISSVGTGRPQIERLFQIILSEVERQIPGEILDHEIHFV